MDQARALGSNTRKTGTSNGCLPPHPLVRSNVLRPNTSAPVVLRVSARYSAVCAETMKTMSVPGSLYSVSPAEYQARSLSPPTPMGASGPSFGPPINPSRETASPVRTFPMLLSSSAPALRPATRAVDPRTKLLTRTYEKGRCRRDRPHAESPPSRVDRHADLAPEGPSRVPKTDMPFPVAPGTKEFPAHRY